MAVDPETERSYWITPDHLNELFNAITVDGDGVATAKTERGETAATFFNAAIEELKKIHSTLLIYFLKDVHDLQQLHDESEWKEKMNTMYVTYFIGPTVHDGVVGELLSKIRRPLDMFRDSVTGKSEKVKTATKSRDKLATKKGELKALSKKTLVRDKTGKLASKLLEVERAQEHYDWVHKKAGEVAEDISKSRDEVEAAIETAKEHVTNLSTLSPDERREFFDRLPLWVKKQAPKSHEDQIAEFNKQWTADMLDLQAKWKNDRVSLRKGDHENPMHDVSQKLAFMGNKFTRVKQLNLPSKMFKNFKDAKAAEWEGITPTSDLWVSAQKEILRLFKRNLAVFLDSAAHHQYQNMMIVDDSYRNLVHSKHRHHRQNSDMVNVYGPRVSQPKAEHQLQYSDMNALVPYQGYDPSRSLISGEAELISVLAVAIMFGIGIVICFIWWVCCAIGGYYVVSQAKAKKKVEKEEYDDLESQSLCD